MNVSQDSSESTNNSVFHLTRNTIESPRAMLSRITNAITLIKGFPLLQGGCLRQNMTVGTNINITQLAMDTAPSVRAPMFLVLPRSRKAPAKIRKRAAPAKVIKNVRERIIACRTIHYSEKRKQYGDSSRWKILATS